MTIPNDVTLLCEKAFKGCTGLTEVVFKEWEGKGGITELYQYMFDGCTNLTKVNVPGGVTKIHNQAFNNCSSLTTVSIPSSCKEIGSYAFFGCTQLSGIELPAVEKLNDHAFKESGLVSILLPSTVTDLGTWTFDSCTSLKYVKLPTSVSLIGEGVFYGCSGLEFITIPANITEFYDNVFNGCSNLMSIYYLADNISFFGETTNQFSGTPGEMCMYTKQTPKENIAGVVWGGRFGDNRKPYVEYEIPYTPAKQYTTFCRDFDVDFSAATGLKAGVATTDLNGTKLKLTVKTSIPAGTGVVLKKLNEGEYKLKIAEESPEAIVGNKLVGVVAPTAIPQTDGGNTNFVLKDGVFKKVKVSDKNNTLAAGKAYLQLPTPPSAPNFTFSFEDDITGINMIQGDELKMNGYYNLAGQHVANPTKGLYIINGKKVVVK